jgi:hypothetical protein
MISRRHRLVGRGLLMVDAMSAISFSRMVMHGVESSLYPRWESRYRTYSSEAARWAVARIPSI